MKHRFWAVLLALMMVLSLLPFGALAAGGACGEDATWSMDGDGVLTISGTGAISAHPWDGADVRSAVIGSGITEIGFDTFMECKELTSVSIPDTVTAIDDYAFSDCVSLCKIELPSGLKHIGQGAFSGCRSLQDVTIPESVTELGGYAFQGCKSLTAVAIPGSVFEVPEAAFARSGLQSVTMHEGIIAVGESAFCECESLTDVELPSSLIKIDEEAFSDCKALSVIELPQGVANICDHAFDSCALREVTLPASVKTIGDFAFSYCGDLSKLTLSKGLESIGRGAFYRCTALQDLTIPEGVTGLGDDAFAYCTALKGLSIPGTVKYIGETAFYDCPGLEVLIIPRGVESIGPGAFGSCTGVRNVTIPLSVTDIGYYAFAGCEKITDVFYEGTEAQWKQIRIDDENDPLLNARFYFGPSDPTPQNPFEDLEDWEYYYEPVLWAVHQQPPITNGVSATQFGPHVTCTRGQVVTFLWRASGEPAPKSSVNPFTDVAEGSYYYSAVLWAVEKGITNGTSETTFSPNAPCTRAHVVTFLYRSEGSPEPPRGVNPFSDVPAGRYYTDAVLWAVAKEITNGTSTTTFSPDNPCTRGQIVTFLYRDKAEK